MTSDFAIFLRKCSEKNLFCADLCENICFPESFLENVCKTGANARGALNCFAVFPQNFILFRNIFAKIFEDTKMLKRFPRKINSNKFANEKRHFRFNSNSCKIMFVSCNNSPLC